MISEIAVENGYTATGFIESSNNKKNTLGTLSDIDQIKIKYIKLTIENPKAFKSHAFGFIVNSLLSHFRSYKNHHLI